MNRRATRADNKYRRLDKSRRAAGAPMFFRCPRLSYPRALREPASVFWTTRIPTRMPSIRKLVRTVLRVWRIWNPKEVLG